jgi:hypothetical protein
LKRGRYRDHPRSKGGAAEAPEFFVEIETEAWNAWIAAGHKRTLTTDRRMKTGWWFRTPFPPGFTPRAAAISTSSHSPVRVVSAPTFRRSFGKG